MSYLLCRNRVAEFFRWKAVFDSHASSHREAGMHLVNVWRAIDEPNDVFFLFEIDSIEAAKEFMAQPIAEEGRVSSGALDGEFHFLEAVGGYATPGGDR